MARPKKTIDYETVEKLASIQCTQEEIASFLDLSVRTLQRDDEFCRLYKKGQENGKMSLRRIQFKLAEKNTSMAIFLGKQYLGQKDMLNQEISTEQPSLKIEVVDNSNLEKVMYEENKHNKNDNR